ncbi:ring finger domain protein [Diplodia corticola]|uniref:Ring finger domain protein n=1 Tax=Diplodia corticola TaxID=236234 RepID=A0A1J9S266_9PEZI|nr:ring finger domain protein [Diplodia corticola]OJD33741.1 ring finger domain protein [Diplodia corticola]
MAPTPEWPVVARDPEAAPANYTPADIPFAGRMISMFMSLVTLCVLSVCIVRRVQRIHNWLSLPLAAWLIVIIYVDSFLFVFVTALFKDVGLNSNQTICEGAILLCLICYMSTKIFIYCFLVEKAYIVRGKHEARLKDKLYLFNCFFMMLPYTIVVILNFVWRIAYINKTGTCIIGMQKRAMMPLIIFDVAVNVYMTALFIVPLRQLYSYKNRQNTMLHTMAFRTFIGSCATLTSSVANLTVLMVLRGEPGWICLLCCNADILFSVLVLHWVTSGDRTGQTTNHSYPSGVDNNIDVDPNPNPRNPNTTTNHSVGTRRSAFGTETIISRHYQEAAVAAAVGKDWPDTMKADIEASCVGVRRGSGEGAIAMNRIVVTHERKMVFSCEEREGEGKRDSRDCDGVSETMTAGGTDGGAYGLREREGSTDGIVDRSGEDR